MTPEDAFRAGSRRHEVDLLRASIIRQHGCRHRPLASPVSQGLRPRVRGRRPAPCAGPAACGRNQERRRHRDGRACPGTGGQHPARPRERQAGGHPAPVLICARKSPEVEHVEMPISGQWPGFSRQGSLTLFVDRLSRFGRYLTPGNAARITRRREAADRREALGHAAGRPADANSGCACSLDRTWGGAMPRPGRPRRRSGPSTRRRQARPG